MVPDRSGNCPVPRVRTGNFSSGLRAIGFWIWELRLRPTPAAPPASPGIRGRPRRASAAMRWRRMTGGETGAGPCRACRRRSLALTVISRLTPPSAPRTIRGFFLRTPASRWDLLARSEQRKVTVDLGPFHGSGGLRGDFRRVDADNFSTRPQGTRASRGEDRVARAPALAAEARRLHARVHDDAEETQLGSS